MSNSGAAGPHTADRSDNDAIARAVQELLGNIRNGSGRQEMEVERAAANYAAIVLQGQVENQRLRVSSQGNSQGASPQPGLQSLSGAFDDVRRAVQQVRAYFLSLADMEIRRMMEDALFGTENPPGSSGTGPMTGSPPPAMFGSLPGASPFNASPGAQATGGEHAGSAELEDTSEKEAPAEEDPPAPAPVSPIDFTGAVHPQDPNVFEGTVKLVIMADGNMQRVVRFVDDLCQRPQFRMLRMEGSPQQKGAELDIGLREPLRLKEIVAQMKNVVRVEDGIAAGGERSVTVFLNNAA